jgi:hypothetical protein
MYRFLIGSEAGTPTSFSVPFQGGEVSLSKPKQLFVVSPSNIAAPTMAPTIAILSKIPYITPAPISFLIPSFIRAFIATVVNFQRLVEVVQVNTPSFDHDPVTLTPKDLLLEEARTNLLIRSSDLSHTSWNKSRIALTTSTHFPIFANMPMFLVTGSGNFGEKYVYRTFPSSSTTRTFSEIFRADTGVFAQIIGGGDDNSFANFNIATGVIGSIGTNNLVIHNITLER